MGLKRKAVSKNKQHDASTSKNSPAYDPTKFINDKAWETYVSIREDCTRPLLERGFENGFEDKEDIGPRIDAMGWKDMALNPTSQGYITLIREFYANLWAEIIELAKTPSNEPIREVTVRGKKIDISPTRLQAFLKIEGVTEETCPLQQLNSRWEREELSRVLCIEPGLISTLNNGKPKTEKKFLKPEVKLWIFFINTRIFPSLHTNNITGDRLFLLYCIMTGKKVHLGKIIYEKIMEAARKKDLFFPALIHKLCMAAHVNVVAGEEELGKAIIIKHVWIKKIYEDRDVDAEDLGTEIPPPKGQIRFSRALNERLDRIEAKQESLAKMMVHLGRQTFKGFKAQAARSGAAPDVDEYEEPDIQIFRRKRKRSTLIHEDEDEDDDDTFLHEGIDEMSD